MEEEFNHHYSDENMDSETDENTSTASSSSSPSQSSTESDDEPEKITLKARKDRRSRWKLLSNKKKFKKEWFKTYSWIEKDPENLQVAICTICKISVKAVKSVLEAHQKSKRHLKKMIEKHEAEAEPNPLSDSNKNERTVDPNKLTNIQAPSFQLPPPLPPQPQQFQQPPLSQQFSQPAAIGIDQITDEQISFFAESQADAAHQAVTSIIDKLVEKYHENRLINLKIQNDAMFELNAERAKIIRTVNQKKLERRLQHEAYIKEIQEAHLNNIITEHETKMHAMERERDAKLRAVEQELVFAKQEYEKKVRLLDSQLSSMK